MQSGAFMLGPVLGAAMYAALPMWLILLSDLVGAVAASLTVASVKIPDPPHTETEKPHFFREMREGAAVFFAGQKAAHYHPDSNSLHAVLYAAFLVLSADEQ